MPAPADAIPRFARWMALALGLAVPFAAASPAHPSLLYIDLGVVRTPEARAEWKPLLKEDVRVTRVSVPCGCTTAGIQENARLRPGQPVEIKVRLDGRPSGHYEEGIEVGLDDGSSVVVRLRMEYQPPPRLLQRHLVFWPGADTRTLPLGGDPLTEVRAWVLSSDGPVKLTANRLSRGTRSLEWKWDGGPNGRPTRGNIRVVLDGGGQLVTNDVSYVRLVAAP